MAWYYYVLLLVALYLLYRFLKWVFKPRGHTSYKGAGQVYTMQSDADYFSDFFVGNNSHDSHDDHGFGGGHSGGGGADSSWGDSDSDSDSSDSCDSSDD